MRVIASSTQVKIVDVRRVKAPSFSYPEGSKIVKKGMVPPN